MAETTAPSTFYVLRAKCIYGSLDSHSITPVGYSFSISMFALYVSVAMEAPLKAFCILLLLPFQSFVRLNAFSVCPNILN